MVPLAGKLLWMFLSVEVCLVHLFYSSNLRLSVSPIRVLMCSPIQKNDPPNYSVAGESTLGTLVIGREPFVVRVGIPYQGYQGHPTKAVWTGQSGVSSGKGLTGDTDTSLERTVYGLALREIRYHDHGLQRYSTI